MCFFAVVGNAFAYTGFIDGMGNGGDYLINGNTYVFEDLSSVDATVDEWDTAVPTRWGYSDPDLLAPSYSGYYLGTVTSGSDQHNFNMADLIEHYAEGILEEWAKAETENSWVDGKLVVTGGDSHSGTWSITGSNSLLNFYTVKGAGSFALYFVDPASSSGTWSTQHLVPNRNDLPTISHFSASIVSTPVPEPSTMIIFGVCFATLAGFRLRKKK